MTTGYVDESVRGPWYMMALVLVPPEQRRTLDRRLRSLYLRGQRRIHMGDESPSRRREIISALVGLAIYGAVYLAPRPVASARPACLSAIAAYALNHGANHLILDRGDDRQNTRDKSVLRDMLAKSEMSYRHAPSGEFPGLQAADILAWAYGAGDDWRRRVAPIVGHVERLRP
jgi:hypothetical protein